MVVGLEKYLCWANRNTYNRTNKTRHLTPMLVKIHKNTKVQSKGKLGLPFYNWQEWTNAAQKHCKCFIQKASMKTWQHRTATQVLLLQHKRLNWPDKGPQHGIQIIVLFYATSRLKLFRVKLKIKCILIDTDTYRQQHRVKAKHELGRQRMLWLPSWTL